MTSEDHAPQAPSVDASARAGAEPDRQLLVQMRALSDIAPSVAHDLRAPINAMVLNLEVLKEMIGSGRTESPTERERLLRYTSVVREELARLHQGLEIFLAQLSPRNQNAEACDLGVLAGELATLLIAPARKRQVTVQVRVPSSPVEVSAHRYAIKQALLHFGLAALAATERSGAVAIELTVSDGSAVLRFTANPVTDGGLAATSESLAVAHALWNGEGGSADPSATVTADPSSAAFELKWLVSEAR